MIRVSILVTHLLGTGHLSRMLILARALREAGMLPRIISGGMEPAHLDRGDTEFVQIPPVRSDGTSFTSLLDERGDPVTPDHMERRRDAIADELRLSPPDVLVTELFPFGRRVLRQEFEAALDTVRKAARPPLIYASVRDILAPPSNARKAVQTEDWLQLYDGVLVHSDVDVVPLEASWPVTPSVAAMLRYTGFIAPPAPSVAPAAGVEGGEILVTAGGGPVGRGLFDAAIEASRMGTRRWRLLVGGADAAATCARLNASADGAPVLAEPARSDYRGLLANCAAAVGQCGYNTAIDWLQAGVPGVFVPFAEAGEVEQTVRAASLGRRYGYGVIAESELTPEKLAASVESALARGRVDAGGLNLEGAANTARMLAAFVSARQ